MVPVGIEMIHGTVRTFKLSGNRREPRAIAVVDLLHDRYDRWLGSHTLAAEMAD